MESRREMCLLVDLFLGTLVFTKPIPSRHGVFTYILFDFKGKSREIHTIHGLFGTCMARDHEITKIFGGTQTIHIYGDFVIALTTMQGIRIH